MFKKKLLAAICCILTVLFLFTACSLGRGNGPESGGEDPPITDPDDGKPDDGKPDVPEEKPFSVSYRAGYTPSNFAADVKNEVTELGAGVHLVKNTVVKTGDITSVVWAVEVDLEKANIVAGTKDNVADGFNWAKAAPYQTALDWENATGGHVYTSLNADFFGSYCVNAFVKDGVIVKDGHNDKGNYDYKNDASDVPASAPMLFGVSGTRAQIAPIVKVDGDPEDPAVKQQFVKAKLFNQLGGNEIRFNSAISNDYINFLTSGSSAKQFEGYAVKVDTSEGMASLKVLEVSKIDPAKGSLKAEAGEGYGYLQVNSASGACARYLSSLQAGDKIAIGVGSPDGIWNGYTTILGCRQALVTGGKIAPTVTKENSNGAQGRDIPRSAVGIKDDHTVVIFAVESLYYYGHNVQEGDTHGMNLPELAEFAYYYGCNEAANFDGGGSTQLVVKGDADETARTVVRSADTGTFGLLDTRPVMNSILVVKR